MHCTFIQSPENKNRLLTMLSAKDDSRHYLHLLYEYNSKINCHFLVESQPSENKNRTFTMLFAKDDSRQKTSLFLLQEVTNHIIRHRLEYKTWLGKNAAAFMHPKVSKLNKPVFYYKNTKPKTDQPVSWIDMCVIHTTVVLFLRYCFYYYFNLSVV